MRDATERTPLVDCLKTETSRKGENLLDINFLITWLINIFTKSSQASYMKVVFYT